MPVARARHADVELAEDQDVGLLRRQAWPREASEIFQSLRVPEHDPRGVAERDRFRWLAEFDGVQRRAAARRRAEAPRVDGRVEDRLARRGGRGAAAGLRSMVGRQITRATISSMRGGRASGSLLVIWCASGVDQRPQVVAQMGPVSVEGPDIDAPRHCARPSRSG